MINTILIIIIMLSSMIFSNLPFKLDFLFTGIFILINYKSIFNFIKNHKYFFSIVLLFLIYLICVCFYHNDISLFFTNVNFLRYPYFILKPLFPIFLLMGLMSIKIDKKHFAIIKKIFLFLFFITLTFGLINYILNFNLNTAGGVLLTDINGRIQSFFGNPNMYGSFLITTLFATIFLYYKENDNFNKRLYYLIIPLSIISIYMTFGRTIFVSLLFFSFLLLIVFIIKKKAFNKVVIIGVLSFIVLPFMPQFDYMLYSTIDIADRVFNTNFSKVVPNIIDFFYKDDDSKERIILEEEYIERIVSWNDNEKSSVQTRTIYREIGYEIYRENMLFGVGSINYRSEAQKKINEKGIEYLKAGLPHNGFLYFLVCYGLIGGILYFSTLFCIIIMILKYSKKKKIINYGALFTIGTFLFLNLNNDVFIGEGYIYIVYILIWMNIINEKYLFKKYKKN